MTTKTIRVFDDDINEDGDVVWFASTGKLGTKSYRRIQLEADNEDDARIEAEHVLMASRITHGKWITTGHGVWRRSEAGDRIGRHDCTLVIVEAAGLYRGHATIGTDLWKVCERSLLAAQRRLVRHAKRYGYFCGS